MNPRIKNVKPNKDYTITLTFINNEVNVFPLTSTSTLTWQFSLRIAAF